MAQIKYGSQTYPWQMNLAKFGGEVPHMADVLVQAGFTGMEAEICMLGDYYKDWKKLKDLLDKKQVTFAALAFHEDWLESRETAEEKARADEAIEFLSHFPTAKLMLCHAAADPVRENNLLAKQKNQIACIQAVARRAAESGIVSVFHPNSAPNSVFRYREDYDIMFDGLYAGGIGYAPDIGHMANGGIDFMEVIRSHRDLVQHVHFKDMTADHTWTTMGQGVIDFKSVVDFLAETDYRGWIMTEDESPEAEKDSDKVVLADGAYMKEIKR